jgi:hypothetical protein
MPNIRNLANVNVGSSPNAGDGDVLREAFIKVNNNINALYNNGQYKAYIPDSKDAPGYTWDGDTDTGLYRPGTGQIGVSLNGAPHLLMNETGSIQWLGDELSTQDYVNQQIAQYTGGVYGANIVVTTGSGNIAVTVNGIPVVAALPTIGNYEGRIAYYTGDIWTYSQYPVGNGAGLNADAAIARAAGSDSRWVRFRGDQAITIGLVRPAVAAEGTTFYETANAKIYVYLAGQWQTLSGLISSNSPKGLDVATSLPTVGDPNNYSGRTIVVGTSTYIFISGAWQLLGNYIGATSSANTGSGISSGATLPLTANVGELFRKTGNSSGLYIYDTGNWFTLPQYTANAGTASIRTLAALPADVTYYNAGDLIIVGGRTYILNTTKTSWDIFSPGANTTVQNIVLNAAQVGTRELANSSLTLNKFIANTIAGSILVSNTITTRELSNNSVTAIKLADNVITSNKIQAGVITDREIAGNSISGSKIIAGSITSRELGTSSISASSISANSLSQISQNAGTITSGIFRSADGKMIIDLNSKFIRIEI